MLPLLALLAGLLLMHQGQLHEQIVAAGTSVDRGTTVEVRFSDSSASGEGL